MIREVKFESQDRRIKQILAALIGIGIKGNRLSFGLRGSKTWYGLRTL